MHDLLGLQIFNGEDFAKLAMRLLIDLVFAYAIVHRYRKVHGDTEYVFTYIIFNVITFTLSFLLRKVPIELGFALGLFAVFGILRYRTEAIRTRDLTYLFIVIGIAILNAVANKKVSLGELLLVNGAIVTLTYAMERKSAHGRQASQLVTYDNLELLRSHDAQALLGDLSDRTGLAVRRVEIRRLDLLRDTADLLIHFDAEAA